MGNLSENTSVIWPESFVEKIQIFEEGHREYKDLWYKLMQSSEKVFMEEMRAAINELEASTSERFDSSDTAPAVLEEVKELVLEMLELIKKVQMYQAAKFFEAFGALSESGESPFKSEKSIDEYRVEDEDFYTLANKFKALIEEHPELKEKASREFKLANERILKKESDTFRNCVQKLDAIYPDLLSEYGVSEIDTKEIQNLVKELLEFRKQQLVEYAEKYYDVIGPFSFIPEQ